MLLLLMTDGDQGFDTPQKNMNRKPETCCQAQLPMKDSERVVSAKAAKHADSRKGCVERK